MAASSCEAQQRHIPQSSIVQSKCFIVHRLSASQLQHDSKIATIWKTSYTVTFTT